MTTRPEDLTVLTTGVNSGIGLATVLEAARRGHRSVGTVRSESKAAVVHAAAAEAGVEVETALLDVTDADRCARIIEQFQPDALVNNAGVTVTGAIEDVTDGEARLAFEAMVLAPMRLSRLAVPYMREKQWGRILNISSIYGRTTTPFSGWYQGCKHALEGLSDALRMEVARDRIKVVLIEPGGFRTGIWKETEHAVAQLAGSRFDANYQRTLSTTKLLQPAMGEPDHCGRVIVDAIEGNPRARYLVGIDAQALGLYETLTPTSIKDRVSRLTLGL
jgi:NAD(P)-dependent dehydrogenase (short-subunit alcohol dehydrogenase family)